MYTWSNWVTGFPTSIQSKFNLNTKPLCSGAFFGFNLQKQEKNLVSSKSQANAEKLQTWKNIHQWEIRTCCPWETGRFEPRLIQTFWTVVCLHECEDENFFLRVWIDKYIGMFMRRKFESSWAQILALTLMKVFDVLFRVTFWWKAYQCAKEKTKDAPVCCTEMFLSV